MTLAVTSAFAPEYRLSINGSPVPSAVRSTVISVRYEDGTGAADRVEATLANPDLRWVSHHIRGLGFQPFPTNVRVGPAGALSGAGDGQFDVANSLDLELGYADGPLEPVFAGEITGVQASFPSSGMPTLTIVAHDHLHRLSQGSYARGFGFLPDAVIAAILSAENLLLPVIDPAVAAGSTAIAVLNAIFRGTGTKQKSQSHLELLQEIATLYDADFWVDGDVLYLSRFMKEYTPRLTLRYGESLIDFSPQVSTVGRVAAVAAKFTLREIPLDFLVSVFWDFDRETLGISVVPGAAAATAKTLIGAFDSIVDQPVSNPADIVNSALVITRELRNKINNRMTGRGSAVGDPRIRAGAVVRLDGMGPDFSGDYRVVKATHTIDGGGYRTAFEVRKEILP